jgi:hypothetical protein
MIQIEKESYEGLVKTHLKKTDSPIISSILRTNIFAPHKKGDEIKLINKDWVFYKKYKGQKYLSKKMHIMGYQFDQMHDFKIWASILQFFNKTSSDDSCSISILENDLLKMIGYNSKRIDKKRKDMLKNRLKRMQDTSIEIELYSPSQVQEVVIEKEAIVNCEPSFLKFSLINTVGYDSINRLYTIELNKNIKNVYAEETWKAINIDVLSTIKTEYAQAIYCFLETQRQSNLPVTINNTKKSTLIEKLDMQNKENKEINRIIKKSLVKLMEMGYISNFEIQKNNVITHISGSSSGSK